MQAAPISAMPKQKAREYQSRALRLRASGVGFTLRLTHA